MKSLFASLRNDTPVLLANHKAFFSLLAVLLVVMIGCERSPREQPWSDEFGSPGEDFASDLAVDGAGNVYVVGITGDALPGQKTFGEADAFLRKYDSEGTVLWTRQFGSDRRDFAAAVSVDRTGSAFVVGHGGSVEAGPTNRAESYSFVRKFDQHGVEQWTRQFGSAGRDWAQGVAADDEGNVYVGGASSWDPRGPGYIRKYDASGTLLWANSIGTDEGALVTGVAVGAQGIVHAAGSVVGALPDQQSTGAADIFIASYDLDGALIRTRQFGLEGSDSAWSIDVDEEGAIYLAGDLEPTPYKEGNRNATLAAVNFGTVGFTGKYDSKGVEIWTDQFGPGPGADAISVSVDDRGDAFVVGRLNSVGSNIANGGGNAADYYIRSYDPISGHTTLYPVIRPYGSSALAVLFLPCHRNQPVRRRG